MEFWTIEVLDGQFSASWWAQSHRESLIEAAVTHGARDWRWVDRDWGVVLELQFVDEVDWLRFRATPAVQAALDAAPDPVSGVHTYRGPGGSSGVGEPVRPRPRPAAGAAALPEPVPEFAASSLPWLDPAAGAVYAEPLQPL
jgi:hypothetical protein